MTSTATLTPDHGPSPARGSQQLPDGLLVRLGRWVLAHRGVVLAIGILLDATIVRALLLPAVVSLLGRWNWWLPQPLARVMRVRPHRPIASQRQVEGVAL